MYHNAIYERGCTFNYCTYLSADRPQWTAPEGIYPMYRWTLASHSCALAVSTRICVTALVNRITVWYAYMIHAAHVYCINYLSCPIEKMAQIKKTSLSVERKKVKKVVSVAPIVTGDIFVHENGNKIHAFCKRYYYSTKSICLKF